MLRMVATVALLALVGLGGLWLAQRRLIYLPSGTPGDPPPGWTAIEFTTADGVELGAWFRPPDSARPTVLVFNGNAGNRSDRLALGKALTAEGFGVVLLDYRGYGGNAGRPTEEGLALDAEAAADWLAANRPDDAVVYFGESLGAAVATRLAVDRPPSALVLRSPFTSLPDVAAVHYPFLPVRSMLWDEYPVLSQIADIAVPLAVVAGSADSIVPPEQSRLVHDAVAGPATWVLVEGADHNDAALGHGSQLVEALLAILR